MNFRTALLALLLSPCSPASAQVDISLDAPFAAPQIHLEFVDSDVDDRWQAFLAASMNYFDRDDDGQLSADEASHFMPLPRPNREPLVLNFSALDANRDTKGSLDEVIAYCREHGFRAHVVEYVPAGERDFMLGSVLEAPLQCAADGGDLPSVLGKLDLNDDDAWTEDELLATAVTPSAHRETFEQFQNDSMTTIQVRVAPHGIAVVSEDTPGLQAIAKNRYLIYHAGDNSVSTLSTLRHLPDVSKSAEFLLAQFRQAMRQSIEIPVDDVRNSKSLAGLADLAVAADRNADDRLALDELQAYFQLVATGVSCQTWVRFVDHDRNLFALLDANSDDSLSVRELSAAEAWLMRVSSPQSSRYCSIAVTGPSAKSWGGVPLPRPAPNPRQPALSDGPKSLPDWLLAMDRNHDGVVTRKESLLSIERFEALDVDRDGLLDAVDIAD
jgi:hypothetical protein